MIAYTLQMLFFALSVVSIVIMLIMVMKNMTANKKQWWLLVTPIILTLMAVAFRFDWTANANNDFSRYIRDFEGLRIYGFDYELRSADAYSWLWRVIAYGAAHMENLHWFPAITIGVELFIYFYILINVATEREMSTVNICLCMLLRLALLPLVISIAAARNSLAYSFFAMGVFLYYRHGLKNLWMYVWMLCGVLTHTTVLLGVVIFVLSLVVRRIKVASLLFLLFGVALSFVLAPALQDTTNEYVQYLVEHWGMYMEDPNQYDIRKSGYMLMGLIPLYVCFLWWYIGRNHSLKRDRIDYVITNIAVSIGVAPMMASLFLRLTYATALLMPLLWAEIYKTKWGNSRNVTLFWFVMVFCVVFFFGITSGGWIHQLYWFFEM